MLDIIGSFVDKKKAESPYVSLVDGESVAILRLREMKIVTKAGFAGEEKEVLRLNCDVDTAEGVKTKSFDNGTQRFAQELQEKGVKIGSSFTITRVGTQTKTRYNLSNVVNPPVAPAAPAPTVTAASPAPAQAAVGGLTAKPTP